jgi:hypothetical protein
MSQTATPINVKPSVSTSAPSEVVSEKVVSQKILDIIGSVPGYSTIRCSRILGNSFRVNVFVQHDASSDFFKNASIAHSYFITFDENANIISYYADKGSKPLVLN